MADFRDFQANYDETTPTKLQALSPERLLFYYDYFSEIRRELYGHDQRWIEMANNRLDLIEKVMARQHADKRDQKTRKLAWIAIGVSALSALGTVGQYLASKQPAMQPTTQTTAAQSTPGSPQTTPLATTPAASATATGTSTPAQVSPSPPAQSPP